jgi:hypothetical protein
MTNTVVITLHKSASMFLFHYFKEVADIKGVKFYSENANNILDFENRNAEESFILSPYRVTSEDSLLPCLPTNLDKLLMHDNTMYIIHIRNPIDILVSEYYSFGFMHRVTENNKAGLTKIREYVKDHTIDEYCIKRARDTFDRYKKFYEIIAANVDNPNYIFSSYSMMKNRYAAWNRKMANRMLLDNVQKQDMFLKYKQQFLLDPLDNADVINNGVKRHIRNGSDKQYVTQLTSETVNTIKEMLSDIIPESIRTIVPDLDFF